MKTALLLFAGLPTFLFSQITITSADFANAGDTVIMSKATDNSIDYSTTGANYSWDFSYLNFDNQFRRDFFPATNLPLLINFVFGTAAPTNYRATYFLPSTELPIDQASAFLPVTISNLDQYTRKTTDSITSIGYSMKINGNGVPVKSDTIETRYAFPLNYGDMHSSRGYTKLDMNPIYNAVWIQHRHRLTEVDGWGEISTPYGSFDVLRVKHTITETDSIRIDFMGNETWIPIPVPESHIYEWIANGEQDAIMRIVTNLIGGNETVTSIEYKDYNLTASLESNSLDYEIYPNPVREELHVKTGGSNERYLIIDTKGSVVQSGTLTGSINVSQLPNGIFELVIVSNHQTGKKTFLKQD